jgi:hypothetical protein
LESEFSETTTASILAIVMWKCMAEINGYVRIGYLPVILVMKNPCVISAIPVTI